MSPAEIVSHKDRAPQCLCPVSAEAKDIFLVKKYRENTKFLLTWRNTFSFFLRGLTEFCNVGALENIPGMCIQDR